MHLKRVVAYVLIRQECIAGSPLLVEPSERLLQGFQVGVALIGWPLHFPKLFKCVACAGTPGLDVLHFDIQRAWDGGKIRPLLIGEMVCDDAAIGGLHLAGVGEQVASLQECLVKNGIDYLKRSGDLAMTAGNSTRRHRSGVPLRHPSESHVLKGFRSDRPACR